MKAPTYAVAPRPSADERARANVFDVSSRQSGSSSVVVEPSERRRARQREALRLMSARIIAYAPEALAPVFASSAPPPPAGRRARRRPRAAVRRRRRARFFLICRKPVGREQTHQVISAPAGRQRRARRADRRRRTPAAKWHRRILDVPGSRAAARLQTREDTDGWGQWMTCATARRSSASPSIGDALQQLSGSASDRRVPENSPAAQGLGEMGRAPPRAASAPSAGRASQSGLAK